MRIAREEEKQQNKDKRDLMVFSYIFQQLRETRSISNMVEFEYEVVKDIRTYATSLIIIRSVRFSRAALPAT